MTMIVALLSDGDAKDDVGGKDGDGDGVASTADADMILWKCYWKELASALSKKELNDAACYQEVRAI
jgi:hypothetical protein